MLAPRHLVPQIAPFAAKLREAFGDATIEEDILCGEAGKPTFFSRENDWTAGTRSVDKFNR